MVFEQRGLELSGKALIFMSEVCETTVVSTQITRTGSADNLIAAKSKKSKIFRQLSTQKYSIS